jgi:hypothetical protein
MDCFIWVIVEGVLKQFVVEISCVGVKIGLIKLRRSVGQIFLGDVLNLTLLWLCVIVKVNVQILVEKIDSLVFCPILLLGVT